jgi:nitroreductase
MADALPTASTDLARILETRRSVDPDFLGAPGPSPEQLERLLAIALRVPDHGMLEPWRLIVLQGEAARTASARIEAAYRQALATDMRDFARDNPEKAARNLAKMPKLFTRAPLVVVVVSTADDDLPKPEWEQVLSAGAVCMNLVAAATLMGFGANWLTGWPAYDKRALDVLGVDPDDEKVAGFIHIGTTLRASPERRRPDLAKRVTRWGG